MTSTKVFLGTMISCLAFGAGFEQELMWSGKSVGTASAVSSTVEGPEALYFNPAGMLTKKSSDEISVNISYLRSQFKAPVNAPDVSEKSKVGNDIVAAILYTHQIDEKLAFGIGLFPSGGLSVKYDDYPTTGGVSGAPKVNLQIIELSPGIAYQVTPEFSLGLAYRITYATADFAVLDPANSVFVDFKKMKGFDFSSFRLGAQYKTQDWGMGLTIRTPALIKVKGSADFTAPGPTNLSDDSAKISTTFPLTVALGSHYKVNPNLTLMFEYDFLYYKQVDDLNISTSLPLPNQDLKWKNGHVFRLGGDYDLNGTHIRAGYIFETAIANPDTMVPTTEAPGPGHLFTVGTGFKIADNAEFNASLFYGIGVKNVTSTTALSGKYTTSGIGLHTGVNWSF